LNNEESSIDEVIRRSSLPSSAVSVALLGLEMKHVVKQLPGNCLCETSNIRSELGESGGTDTVAAASCLPYRPASSRGRADVKAGHDAGSVL